MTPLALGPNSVFQRVINSTAAGITTITSTAIDMQGFNRLTVMATFGALTSTTVTSIKLTTSDDDGATDTYDDIAGSSVAIADTGSNKMVILDINAPLKRYLKVVVTRGTANAVIDTVTVIKHAAIKVPIVAHSTVANSKVLNQPGEGTA